MTINDDMRAQLAAYAARYRQDLTASVIPFWLDHSLDREHGGYFTCLERDGAVYDTKKYVWLQGRAIWMFSELYRTFDPRPAYLDAAKLGVDFLRRYGRDGQGRFYFSLTREGQPHFFQRKPFGAVFAMLGLLGYGRASGDQSYVDEAIELFWQIVDWIDDPGLLDRPALVGQVASSSLANQLVLGTMLCELVQVADEPRYQAMIQQTIDGIVRHYDRERRIFVENVALDGRDPSVWPEFRLFNPGHSIETVWILLHLLRLAPNAVQQQLALDALAGSLDRGWDAEYGGLFYFMDTAGKPTLQIEATMKLWWPHAEAIYTLVLAATLTGDARWLEWLEKVDAYSYTHFVDPAYGEWFGYLDRRGDVALTSKGGSYKGFFHVPRALLMSVQCIEGVQ